MKEQKTIYVIKKKDSKDKVIGMCGEESIELTIDILKKETLKLYNELSKGWLISSNKYYLKSALGLSLSLYNKTKGTFCIEFILWKKDAEIPSVQFKENYYFVPVPNNFIILDGSQKFKKELLTEKVKLKK